MLPLELRFPASRVTSRAREDHAAMVYTSEGVTGTIGKSTALFWFHIEFFKHHCIFG